MKLPLPCRFGEKALCEGEILTLIGADWFKWTQGIEYTYFFEFSSFWHDVKFYTTYQKEQPCYFEIPDKLLVDGPIKDKGYPLKGKGYTDGIRYKNGKTYVDFIMTSNYFMHIKVECDNKGLYQKQGNIIYPFNWDEEKSKNATLKAFQTSNNEQTHMKPRERDFKQLTLFEII
jgi:hypothetical protein